MVQQKEPTALTEVVSETSKHLPVLPGTDSSSTDASQPIPSTFAYIQAAGTDVRDVANTAMAIADAFNHAKLRVTHLLLALTLTTDGVKRLKARGLDKDAIRRATWRELTPHDPTPERQHPPVFSEDVTEIFDRANSKAYSERAQPIAVDDIVFVVSETPLKERFEHYWNGAPVTDPTTAALEILRRLEPPLTEMIKSTGAAQLRFDRGITRIKHLSVGSIAVTVAGAGALVIIAALMLFRP